MKIKSCHAFTHRKNNPNLQIDLQRSFDFTSVTDRQTDGHMLQYDCHLGSRGDRQTDIHESQLQSYLDGAKNKKEVSPAMRCTILSEIFFFIFRFQGFIISLVVYVSCCLILSPYKIKQTAIHFKLSIIIISNSRILGHSPLSPSRYEMYTIQKLSTELRTYLIEYFQLCQHR